MNSKELASDLTEVSVADDEILNSHDVVALFTSTPIEHTLDIIKRRLEDDKDLKNSTRLTVNDLMELCESYLPHISYSMEKYTTRIQEQPWVVP